MRKCGNGEAFVPMPLFPYSPIPQSCYSPSSEPPGRVCVQAQPASPIAARPSRLRVTILRPRPPASSGPSTIRRQASS